MRRFLALTWLLAFLPASAQVTPPTYPYAKPRPTTGVTPDWMIRWSTTVAPSAHRNENPLLWSVDVAGGLQSRLDAVDRLNIFTNWTQEGAVVFDASDRTYYGVDTNLLANKPLFTLDGVWLGPGSTNDISIYTSNGTLSSNRTVNGGFQSLIFTNLSSVGVQATNLLRAVANEVDLHGTNSVQIGSTNFVEIAAGGPLPIQMPAVANSINLTAPSTYVTGDLRQTGSRTILSGSLQTSLTGGNAVALASGASTTIDSAALLELRATNSVNVNSYAGTVSLNANQGISATAGGSIIVHAVTNITLRTNIAFYSANVAAGWARSNQVWKLRNSTNGLGEWGDSEVGQMIVTNVAQLLTVATGATNGYQHAATLGYYTIGDGGAGVYYSAPFSAGLTNTGNFQSTYDPTRMWSLLEPREGIYLKQYGAKGDGVTDDTLPANYWLADANGGIAVVNVGVYIIDGVGLQPNSHNIIRGNQPVGDVTAHTLGGGFYFANCAVFKRKPGTSNPLLFTQPDGVSTITLSNIILDGNRQADTNNAANYLFLAQSSGACVLRSVMALNTAGHGIGFANVKNCVLDNFTIASCGGRGLRVNSSYNSKVSNGSIFNCAEEGLWILSAANTSVRDVKVVECGMNGLRIEGITYANILNCVIQGHKRACVSLWPSVMFLHLDGCTIRNANVSSNAATSVAASPSGTWPLLLVEGTAASVNFARNSIVNCNFGYDDLSLPAGYYGTNQPVNIFRWVSTGVFQQPWETTTFMNNDCLGPLYGTNLTFYPWPDSRRWINQFAQRNIDSFEAFQFGGLGTADRTNGWHVNAVASATGDDALAVNSTSHRITKTGAAIIPLLGSPVQIPGPTAPPIFNPDDP